MENNKEGQIRKKRREMERESELRGLPYEKEQEDTSLTSWKIKDLKKALPVYEKKVKELQAIKNKTDAQEKSLSFNKKMMTKIQAEIKNRIRQKVRKLTGLTEEE